MNQTIHICCCGHWPVKYPECLAYHATEFCSMYLHLICFSLKRLNIPSHYHPPSLSLSLSPLCFIFPSLYHFTAVLLSGPDSSEPWSEHSLWVPSLHHWAERSWDPYSHGGPQPQHCYTSSRQEGIDTTVKLIWTKSMVVLDPCIFGWKVTLECS